MPQKSIPLAQRDGWTFRISELPSIGRCPGFALSQIFREGTTTAADTGSLAGRIIQLFHELGGDSIALEAASRKAVTESGEQWPKADVEEAVRVAGCYALDERNWNVVVPGSCELEVRVTLDPAPEDPTGRPINLIGHLDQVRTDRAGRMRYWDTKNSGLTGLDLLYGYAWQVSAYCLGASAHYGRTVLPGGIIRLQGYGKKLTPAELKDATVFFEAPWDLAACRSMMQDVAQHVAWLRLGIIHHHPGAHCVWCPAGGPHLCGDYIQDAYPNGVPV